MLNNPNIFVPKQKHLIYIALILVVLAVFWQVHEFDFVNIDDNIYITHNFNIKSGITLDSISWAFSTKYTFLWNPLVWLSFMVDYQIYGLNAGGYHLTNLILHILSTLLLFWLFNRMTKEIWPSAFVAALFALHPLHVESVAWIAERKDVLSAFFWMLTLCLYVYYTEKQVIKRYLLVLFSFALALMSKPMVVTLPVIMILLDYWPLKRFQSQKENLFLWQLKEKLPLIILSAVPIIITFYTPDKIDLTNISFISRLANAPVSFVTYFGKTFWPGELAVFYPFPEQIPIWQTWGATILIIFITVFVILVAKRFPYLLIGWLWYMITIVPVIGIVQIGDFAMADRYHYLPSIGIGVILAWGTPLLFQSKYLHKKILWPVAIAALTILAVLAWQQCGYWKNSITLFSHALQVTEDNYIAYNNFAVALAEEGETKQAVDNYTKALSIRPNYFSYYINRGSSYAKLGQYKQAIDDYNMAIRLKPDCIEAYYNRGCTYSESGQYHLAVEDFNKAISLKPDYVDAHYNRGIVYAVLGQYDRAIENFNKAINLKEDYLLAYYSRGRAYLLQGKNERGCLDAEKLCSLGNCQLLETAKSQGRCR